MNTIDFKTLQKYNKFNVNFYKAIDEYKKFILNEKVISFLDIADILIPDTIYNNDLVFKNKGSSFKFEFSNKEIKNKQKYFVLKSKNSNFSESYLLWFLNHKEIQEYIKVYANGSIIFSVNQKVFDDLEVIYPTKKKYINQSVVITNDSKFKDVIKIYLKEYQINIKYQNYLSASFLVGSICEALLYTMLRDSGLSENDLKGKKFGNLLEFIKVRDLEENIKIDDFKKINNFRNLIHPERAFNDIEKIYSLEKEIEPIFNRIIKTFGL